MAFLRAASMAAPGKAGGSIERCSTSSPSPDLSYPIAVKVIAITTGM